MICLINYFLYLAIIMYLLILLFIIGQTDINVEYTFANKVFTMIDKSKLRGVSNMHMADALVSPIVAGTMYTCSAAVAIYSGNKVKVENDLKKVSAMGVMGAFVFATQMINFTIPGTGSSGHLCGGMLLAVILGPYAAFCTMIGILMIQCLMFADGGLLALGANIWNMAFYGCFIGYFFIWRPLTKAEITKKELLLPPF